jgi:peptidyl-prolyl cis-trans isomerase C
MTQKIFKTLFLFVIIMSATAANAATVVGVAATVNGYEIKESKLQKALESNLKAKGTNVGSIRDPKRYKQLREEVLDVLIGQKLLWLSAKKDGLLISDEKVNKLYASYQGQYAGESDFLEKMKLEGYTEKSYRQELRQQLSAKKWLHKNVISKLKVNNDEIRDFYNKNEHRFKIPEQVHALHILIKIDKKSSNKDKKKAKKLLLSIKKKLKAGENFAALAKKHSEGPSAPKGGDLGFFSAGQMVKPFEVAAFKLKAGKVSDVVETQFGYHIIKMVEKKLASKVEQKDVAKRISQHLMKIKSEAALKETISKLMLKAKIEKNIF